MRSHGKVEKFKVKALSHRSVLTLLRIEESCFRFRDWSILWFRA